MVVLLHPLVHDGIAAFDFLSRREILESSYKNDVGLAIARIDIVEDIIVADPALRLGKFLVRQRVVAASNIADRMLAHPPSGIDFHEGIGMPMQHDPLAVGWA